MCHNEYMVATSKHKVAAGSQITVGPQGRIVIPAPLRKALNIQEGQRLIAHVEKGRLVMDTAQGILERIQAEFARKVPRGVSAVDELIAERRAEAKREREESERYASRRR